MDAEIVIFGGNAHPELADEICSHLGVPRSPVVTSRFANDCLQVQLQANCRERDVYIIQPLVPPVQENLVELLLMADAARGASAARVTAVMSHYAYARSDKKDAPRISIGDRLVADRDVIVLDDEIARGTTVLEILSVLRRQEGIVVNLDSLWPGTAAG